MHRTLLLIVDDQDFNRDALAAVFRSDGYDTLVAEDGRAALVLAQRYLPDLILLDLMMPGMDGWETLAALRKDTATAAIPVAAVTALEGGDLSRRLREAGFCAYVKKGTPVRRLRELIAACVEHAGDEETWIE